jgi:hypothetical protein
MIDRSSVHYNFCVMNFPLINFSLTHMREKLTFLLGICNEFLLQQKHAATEQAGIVVMLNTYIWKVLC